MSQLHDKVQELFDNQKIKMFIGFTEGTGGNVQPIFINKPELAEKLIYDERCKQNLLGYIHKPDVKKQGTIGIITNPPGLRTVLQLASEKQLKDGQFVVLSMGMDGTITEFSTYKDIEQYLAHVPLQVPDEINQKIDQILAMTPDERWNFWVDELSVCIKCYACRSGCPMCYCTQCTVECNKPQWVPIPSTAQGNMEWHILRAMHLAGRCISCGECSRACPLDIPLGLLNAYLNRTIYEDFGQRPGLRVDLDYALNSFKVEDKENFIR